MEIPQEMRVRSRAARGLPAFGRRITRMGGRDKMSRAQFTCDSFFAAAHPCGGA
jgi:hypothetical protein